MSICKRPFSACPLQRLERYDFPAVKQLAGVCLPLVAGYALAAVGVLASSSPAYDVVATWMVPLAVALLLCDTDVSEYVWGACREERSWMMGMRLCSDNSNVQPARTSHRIIHVARVHGTIYMIGDGPPRATVAVYMSYHIVYTIRMLRTSWHDFFPS